MRASCVVRIAPHGRPGADIGATVGRLTPTLTELCQGCDTLSRMPRDFLAATRERVVVFDGSMGATLEQFDLTQADYGGLEGKCHEALVLHRPDVIQSLHESMA